MKRLGKRVSILLPIAVLLLTLHPQGLRVHYADPTAGAHDVAYPYYAAVAVQYGNWGPTITMALSGLLAVLGIMTASKEKLFLRKMMLVTAVVAVLASLINILYGSMTFIGGTITALLILECVVCWYLAYK